MSRPLIITSALAFGFTITSPLVAQDRAEAIAPAPIPASEPASPGTPSAPPATEGAAQVSLPEASPASPETPPSEPPVESSEGARTSTETSGAEAKGEPSPSEPPAATSPSEEKPPVPYDGPATILDDDGEKMHLGGYGGLTVLGTSIYKRGGLLVGGEGVFLLDHRLAIGLAGYGLASEVKGPNMPNGDTSILGFGYGGTVLRYHLVSKRSPVTASIGTLIGAGGLTLIEKVTSDDFGSEYDYSEDTEAAAFFVAEPSIQANLHLTRWMRFGVSAGYRFVRGPTLRGIRDEDLEGVTAGGHLQFGCF